MKFIGTSTRFSLLFISICLFSCSDETKPSQTESISDEIEVQSDDAVTPSMLKMDGEIFSIPSPVQIAILFKRMNVEYNSALLNNVESAENYTSRFQKALNLGVYGADLAYLSNYQDNQKKLNYFKAITDLSQDLDIQNSIDQELIDRFAANRDNADSLHSINAALFKAGDQYLKENQEEEVATLILTGGWIESMHIAVQAAKANPIFLGRVGEQKHAISSVLGLLSKLDNEQSKALSMKFEDLKDIFAELEYEYKFEKPITDGAEKVTYFNSKSSIEIDEPTFLEIEKKVNEIRQFITK
ncbi:MAG: hypothetical protein ACPGED_08950 [Flavobacteriales bacterium]